MVRPHRRSAAPSLVPAALALALCASLGCGAPVVAVNITVATKACDGATTADPGRNPVAGVDKLRFKITGDKFPTLTQDVAFADGGLAVPNLPLGTNRRITVEARKGNTLWARADSGPFDVLDGKDLNVALILRVVDSFTFTGRPGGGACSKMVNARVGHAMSLLPDGRVLITGGFSLDSQSQLHYQKDAEVYDPADGSFTALPSSPAYRRTGHAALSIGNSITTGILLGGGEGPSDATGGPSAVRPYELFSGGVWQILQPGTTSPSREHHAAVVDLKKGYAVFAGGLNNPDTTPVSATVLDSVSYFDFEKGIVVDVDEPLALRLFDAAIVSRANSAPGGQSLGGFVLLGGRTSTGDATNQISGMYFSESLHKYTRDKLWEAAALSSLPTPRVRHFAVRLIDDSIAVIGGLTKAVGDYGFATDAVTQVNPTANTVGDLAGAKSRLSQARGDGCGVLLEGGAVLYAGGAWKDAGGKSRSLAWADVVSLTSNGADDPVRALQGPAGPGPNGPSVLGGLQAARHRAACVRLRDGTVLVTGGFQYAADGSGVQTTLDSAEIYTPPGAP
jgi:hypothetical protein